MDEAMKKVLQEHPFLREHLASESRSRSGPDIVVENPEPGMPGWYDVATESVENARPGQHADWGVGKTLDWDMR